MVEKVWGSPVPETSDLGGTITDEFVDGAFKGHTGSWAMMTPAEHKTHGVGLGPGSGQRYKKQKDGRWLKVEG